MNKQVIEALQQISEATEKASLIEQFKQDFPEHHHWLDVFNKDASEQVSLGQKLPQIPNLTLIKPLGSGASGRVFLAQDDNHQEVAVKVALGYLSEDQLHRFQHESQLLAGLSHPNIARLIDSGVMKDENLPYLIMEYVDGQNILQYCQQKSLEFKQIITLFVQVLDAIQYAHNRGVVHRDIKPENIFVDRNGHVKLLDFGIALATKDSTQQLTQLTKTGEIVGTLAYMSPEQVSAQSGLDTRADVYSLGVVLYQLLSGALPHQLNANQIFLAISQIIEDLPARINTYNDKIDADLAAIVHHAIEKKPDQRYQSPRDIKRDLLSWLDGEPISVKDNTLWRSIRHISKKHKALVTGSLLAVIGLITGLIFAISFALKEQQAREIAETNAKTNEKTVEFINEIFASADPENLYGEKLTLLQVINNADTALIGQLNEEYAVESKIRLTIAGVYVGIGQHALAQKQLDKVTTLFSNIAEPEQLVTLQYEHAKAQVSINLYNDRYQETVEFINQKLSDQRFNNQDHLQLKSQLAQAYLMLGQLDQAMQTIDEAIETGGNLEPSDADLLFSRSLKAMIFDKLGQFDEAKKINEEVIAIRKEFFGENHPRTLSVLNNQSAVEDNLGNSSQAREIMKQVINGKQAVLGDAHLSTFVSKTNLLSFYVKHGETEKADGYSKELLAEMNKHIGPLNRYTLVVNNIRAYLLEDLGKLDEAETLYRQTLTNYQNIGKNSGEELLVLQSNTAMLLMKQEKYKESQEMFLRLLDNVESTISKDHVYYAIFIGNYGELLLKMHEYEEAEPLLKNSYEKIRATFGAEHDRTIKAQKRLDMLSQAQMQ